MSIHILVFVIAGIVQSNVGIKTNFSVPASFGEERLAWLWVP